MDRIPDEVHHMKKKDLEREVTHWRNVDANGTGKLIQENAELRAQLEKAEQTITLQQTLIEAAKAVNGGTIHIQIDENINGISRAYTEEQTQQIADRAYIQGIHDQIDFELKYRNPLETAHRSLIYLQGYAHGLITKHQDGLTDEKAAIQSRVYTDVASSIGVRLNEADIAAKQAAQALGHGGEPLADLTIFQGTRDALIYGKRLKEQISEDPGKVRFAGLMQMVLKRNRKRDSHVYYAAERIAQIMAENPKLGRTAAAERLKAEIEGKADNELTEDERRLKFIEPESVAAYSYRDETAIVPKV